VIRPTCISTLGCAELDLDGALGLARRFGLAQLEIRALSGRLDLPVLFGAEFGSPDALAARVRAAAVTVPVLATSFSLGDPDPNARADLLAFVPWAEALGVRHLRVFDGGRFAPSVGDPAIEAAAATVRWWQEQRAKNRWSVDIAVETHELLCASANLLRLQRRLEQPVPVLWDTWHTWFKAGEAPRETWTALGGHIVHIHFKDGVRRPTGQFPYTYGLPGEGEFPLDDLADLLDSAGYSRSICLEWERRWHPYLPPLEAALAAISSHDR